ncbi:GNAT family N-acetyltransferase [Wenjunlia tyrosinilytica]|uniref:GNAT family acetyltransferase n=1 Tax=Wenjunlia tyrosinilytica TaxID=1544741 RepID=A0A917ZTA4_9ACTN|nr:GNAT family N-acetyltransferase [Wenjunlia tyrosinilytica]GGO90913.1 GNAT family acetyltransferase [Wenjunlia tyrosinilytica]
MEIFLETERLVLRRFTEADADDLTALDRDPGVLRFIGTGEPPTREAVRNEILPGIMALYERSPGLGFWAAVDRAAGGFLGWFEFRPVEAGSGEVVELGYRLRTRAWGRGCATEGARALVRKGFTELGVRRVVATTMSVNTGSRRVMEKAGLTYVRTLHETWPEYIEGAEHGDVEYALDRGDWTP